MKSIAYAVIGVLTLTTAGVAVADDIMSNMQGMSRAAAPAAKHGMGVGVFKSVDAKTYTVTIQHGPIVGVGWSAMTMTFKAASGQLKGLKEDDKVRFSVRVQGLDNAVTAIRKS
jgi:Cu/Ag efflux protein CusF